MSKKSKTQSRHFINQNPVEALGNMLGGIGDSITSDLVAPGASDFIEQMFGVKEQKKPAKTGGDLHEGEALDLKKASHSEIEPAIDYRREIIHADKTSSSENREIKARVEEILSEIQKLAQSSQELESQFKDVVVQPQIVNPGKYHENLFQWMYTIVKTARMRIEESVGWMSAMHSKKDKKYWSMFKKHGTSFGLSNERSVATQVG